ncbi:hypothetical protein CANMA_001899, partial [Candida margitis]|uniref:uncharacterized protein n=1 Tax=Candida margitis TaxID=1775924 RepID=UPI002226DAA9
MNKTAVLPHNSIDKNNIDAIVETDTMKWPSIIQNDVKTQAPQAYISSFGTTRATAGSAEQFRAIDYGINYDAAKSAKEIDVKTCILISTIGANANSPFLY